MIPVLQGRPSGIQFVMGLSPAAWYRYGVGITVTGQGVSTWADQSGNARDLLQGTDGARPPLQADNSILFNGTDEFLKAAAFTLNQPITVYFLGKSVTFSDSDYYWDGEGQNDCGCRQISTAVVRPRMNSGLDAPEKISTVAVDTYFAIASAYDTTSSVIQVNNEAEVTGDVGTDNAGGFTLAARGDGAAGFGNIQVKEVILYAAAHTAAQRAGVISYLMAVGGI